MNNRETREFLEFVRTMSRAQWFALPRLTTGEVIVRTVPTPHRGAMEVFRVPKGTSFDEAKAVMIEKWAERDQGRKAVSGG